MCSTLGVAEPGVDETWSKPVVGTIQLVDRYRVIESPYPPNMGTGYMGEEISATFNMPVGCDKDNGNYWFDVKMTQDGQEIPSTYYTVHCEESTIYMKPTGNGVCFRRVLCAAHLIDSRVDNRASSSTST